MTYTNTTYFGKSYMILEETPEYQKTHAEATQEMEELVAKIAQAEKEKLR